MKNVSIYISDEGLGPIVRQQAIIEALRSRDTDISFTINTERHIEEAKKIISDASFTKKYNNIYWHKSDNGSPDTQTIKKAFTNYLDVSDQYIAKELEHFNADFIISDFVYESFEVASRKKIPAFGVAHFTWDWFFSKLSPPPLETAVLNRFYDFANKADVLFFPPFTPAEILKHYKKKIQQVPLIVRKRTNSKKITDKNKFNVLLIDSGSGVLLKSIQKAISNLGALKDFHFYASSAFESKLENVTLIDKNELFIDYISQVDLVIGRAGFNTISECIAMRTPMLLLGEAMNPEMSENIMNIKKEGLGSFISLTQFTEELTSLLPKFVSGEYNAIKENMKAHTMPINGAEVIAENILNRIK